MRIAYMASDAIALESMKMLRERGMLGVVVSNPDRPQGRGQKTRPNEVSAWAEETGTELLRPERGPDGETLARFRQIGVDVIVVMAYGHILNDDVLNYAPNKIVNLHGSILPELRGASPIETAIASGKTSTGVSLMKIVKRMDAGAVADCEIFSIEKKDTAASVREKMGKLGARLLERNLEALEKGSLNFVEQAHERATFTRKLDKTDRFLDFRKSAEELDARIRAFGCGIFEYENLEIKVGAAVYENLIDECGTANLQSGEIICASPADGLKIACGEGVLKILKLQKPCAKMMDSADFLRSFSFGKNKILKSFDNKNLLK